MFWWTQVQRDELKEHTALVRARSQCQPRSKTKDVKLELIQKTQSTCESQIWDEIFAGKSKFLQGSATTMETDASTIVIATMIETSNTPKTWYISMFHSHRARSHSSRNHNGCSARCKYVHRCLASAQESSETNVSRKTSFQYRVRLCGCTELSVIGWSREISHTHACMFVRDERVCTYTHIRTCMYVCTSLYTCTYIDVCTGAQMCI